MLDRFINELKELYDKIPAITIWDIKEFKENWSIKNEIGEKYQELCKSDLKKDMGSFYTPGEIVDFMVQDSLKEVDFRHTPNIKILDPSCGGGYFLSKLYTALLKKAIEAGIERPEEHVIKHNIFGCDTDEIAVMLTTLELFELSGIISDNIQLADFLFDYSGELDIIIGNPPYMGHKILVGEYREKLYQEFGQVFYDKADFSYCFIKKSIDLLKNNGALFFLTSRYMIEALNGEGIRQFLLQAGHIKSIFDFYGVRVIKGAKVDNIILTFIKKESNEPTYVYRLDSSAEKAGQKVFEDIEYNENHYVKVLEIKQANLDKKGFVFLDSTERALLAKIKGKRLEEYCESYQGIITGCDKAFVLSKQAAKEQKIDKQLLLPWIKGKNISRFLVSDSEEVLIYSNLISNEEGCCNSIAYINKYKSKLQNRRECKTGTRKWYQLQWGRNLNLFLDKKIIFPYKSASNRFAIDSGNSFSADVYAIKLKQYSGNICNSCNNGNSNNNENSSSNSNSNSYGANSTRSNDINNSQNQSCSNGTYTYEFLVALLNSSLYEFYIKTIAKKLGSDLYEYYPNKIMTLRIPEFIEELDLEARNNKTPSRERIDMILNRYLNITDEEYQIIRKWCK